MTTELRIFTEPQQGASYEQLLAVAKATEAHGFGAFFRSDHYLKMGDVSGLPGPSDAWITLAGIARETSRIRLGTLVTPITFRHPGVLATSVANVDDMSGGRVELGIGAGWYDAEHAAYAIPFPPLGQRFEMLEEQLEIITGLWKAPAGETFTFAGKHHSVVDSPGLPKPAQRPTPPIVIGGGGRTRTPRLAATFASEFNLAFAPVGFFVKQTDRVRAACEAGDRDPATMVFSTAQVVCCGADDAEIARRAKAIGREVGELRENGLAGTPAEVADKISTFAVAGATRVYLQVLDLDDLDHLALVATEVMPLL
jgi:F420-dependent oxidoreductase-like protein